MQAYRIERFDSVDGIELRSSDDLRPGLREVLMRVRASSLNYRDLISKTMASSITRQVNAPPLGRVGAVQHRTGFNCSLLKPNGRAHACRNVGIKPPPRASMIALPPIILPPPPRFRRPPR
jgi:hypothetical protein